MTEQQFTTEKQILMAMRKTLAKIVRDLTPTDAATRYPLNDDTVSDVKMCFDLIASRERELSRESGLDNKDKPRFVDEPDAPKTISISGLSKTAGREEND